MDKEKGYLFKSSTFGKLKPGDMVSADPFYGLSYVVSVEAINDTRWPSVNIVLESRSLGFSRVKSEHSDIRYLEYSIIRYSQEACVKVTNPNIGKAYA